MTVTGDTARRAALGAFVGTAIEWYDFYLFGTAAALVLPTVFFPQAGPAVGPLASFATFWAGFLSRPLGGIVFGHIGDRLGRKNTLVVTLMIMGISTVLTGLLPGADRWGVAAPILLVVLRAAQGFAVGGEWGGAVLMASESAGRGRGVRSAMWVQQGSPVGNILATTAFIVVGLIDKDAFLSWGWRIPFLASAVLVVVGLLIRLKVEESPEFEAAASDRQIVKVPIAELLRHHWAKLVMGVLACALGIGGAYFTSTFMLSYTTGQLGVDRQVMLLILLGPVVAQFGWQPFAARLAERIGTARFMVLNLGAAIVLAFPAFFVVSKGNPVGILLVLVAVMIPTAGYYAVLAGFLAEAFPVRIRYTGISVAYQLSATLIGGTTPLIGQLALTLGGGSWVALAVFYVVLIGLTVVGVVGVARRRTPAEQTAEPAALVDG